MTHFTLEELLRREFWSQQVSKFDKKIGESGRANPSGRSSARPSFNLEKTGEGVYFLSFPVPGVDPDDIKIVLQSSKLQVEVTPSGTLTEKSGMPDDGISSHLVHRGFSAQGWSTSFYVREGLTPKVAYVRNGVLIIELYRDLYGYSAGGADWSGKPYALATSLGKVPISLIANEA